MPTKWKDLDSDLDTYYVRNQSKADRIRELVSGIMTQEEIDEVFGLLEEIETEIDDGRPTSSDEYGAEIIRECLQNGHLMSYDVTTENVSKGIGNSRPRRVERVVDLEFRMPIEDP